MKDLAKGLEPPGGGGRVRSDHPSLGDGCGGMSGDCIGKGTCAKVTLRSGGDKGREPPGGEGDVERDFQVEEE